MSSGREFQSVNALLKDLSRPQFVFDLTLTQFFFESHFTEKWEQQSHWTISHVDS